MEVESGTDAQAVGDDQGFKYWAFISYSHADRRWGRWLHRALESYRVPRKLIGAQGTVGSVPARISPIFRDKDELAAGSSLPAVLEDALEASRYLIVVCSPNAVASDWVNQEILAYKRLGRSESILYLVVGGEAFVSDSPDSAAEEAVPTAGRYELAPEGSLSTRLVAEPLAADVRGGRAERTDAKLRLVSAIVGVAFDDLRRRDERRRRRRLAAIVGAALVVAVVMAGLAVAALVARNEAVRNAREAASRQLAAQSGVDLTTTPDRALLLAVEALGEDDTIEAQASVLAALDVLPYVDRFLQPALDRGVDPLLGSGVLTSASRGVAIAHDSTRVAVGQGNGTVAVWDLDSGTKIAESGMGHVGPVNAVAFSPDQRSLATGGTDGTVRLWNADSLEPIGNGVQAHDGPIFGLGFALEGSVLVTTGMNELRLWDLDLAPIGGPLVSEGGPILSFALDGSGTTALTGDRDGGIEVWDLRERVSLVAGTVLEGQPIFGSALTGDGELAAIAVNDNIVFFSPRTGAGDGAAVQLPSGVALGLAFSGDGRWLVVGTDGGEVVLIDVANRTVVPGAKPHRFNVWSTAFELGSHRAVSAAEDGSVVYWDFDLGPQVGTLLRDSDGSTVWSVAAGGGTTVTGDAAGGLKFWTGASGDLVDSTTATEEGSVSALAMSPDSSVVAVGTGGGELSLWNLDTRTLAVGPVATGQGGIHALVFSSDGRTLAAGGGDPLAGGGWIMAWAVGADAFEGELLYSPQDPVYALAFDPGGSVLVAGGGDVTSLVDGWLVFWDTGSGQLIGEPVPANDRAVLAASFSTSAEQLVTGGGDGSLMIWDPVERSQLGPSIRGHESPISALSYSDDSALIFTAAGDGAIRVWDAARLEPLADLSRDVHEAVTDMAVDPSLGMIFVSGLDGSVAQYLIVPEDWAIRACEVANRSLTAAEWERHMLDGRSYEPICAAPSGTSPHSVPTPPETRNLGLPASATDATDLTLWLLNSGQAAQLVAYEEHLGALTDAVDPFALPGTHEVFCSDYVGSSSVAEALATLEGVPDDEARRAALAVSDAFAAAQLACEPPNAEITAAATRLLEAGLEFLGRMLVLYDEYGVSSELGGAGS